MKVREERETSKKKAIAFKATTSSFDEEESSKDGDEDFVMLIWKVGKMFYKKGRQFIGDFSEARKHFINRFIIKHIKILILRMK